MHLGRKRFLDKNNKKLHHLMQFFKIFGFLFSHGLNTLGTDTESFAGYSLALNIDLLSAFSCDV